MSQSSEPLATTNQNAYDLHKAIIEDDLPQIRSLIQSGIDINVKYTQLKLTPIVVAIVQQKIPLIEVLINAGADLNIEDAEGSTAWGHGISTGSVEIVKCLLDLGADIGARFRKNDTVLHRAAEDGNVNLITFFIEKGIDVNIRNKEEETPLHAAVRYDKIESIKALLANGADVNAPACTVFDMLDEIVPMGSNVTPLFLAAVLNNENQLEIAKILIEAGANVSAQTSKHYTALHPAAQEGYVELVKMLTEAKIDVNVKSEIGRTALSLAAKSGHLEVDKARQLEVVRVLLNVEGIDVNPVGDEGETPLLLAVEKGYFEIVKLLVANGAPINAHYDPLHRPPLWMAILFKHPNIAEWLVKNGADVRYQGLLGFTALHNACCFGSPSSLIKLLIDKGCDVNAETLDGRTPLMAIAEGDAARSDNVDLFKYLVSRGADPNKTFAGNITPLHQAAGNGQTRIVEYLITIIKDINCKTSTGITPLFLAVKKNKLKIVDSLLKHGANPNISDEKGQTPLFLATRKGLDKIMESLVKYGANVNNLDGVSMQTPLFCAADANNLQVAKFLLRNGADVNIQDGTGKTPLYMACEKGHQEMIRLFLKYGADTNIKDNMKGYPPLCFAIKDKSLDLVETFLAHGANVNASNKSGVLPVHIAARTLNTSMVKLLLNRGAYHNMEAHAKNYAGPPVMFAQKAHKTKLIELFGSIKKLFSAVEKNDYLEIASCIEAGVIVNARNADGKTALHYTVKNGNTEATNLLLEHKADVSLATNDGELPLHIAAASGNVEIARFLLTHMKGLNFLKHNRVINSMNNESGATALHVAAEKNHPPIVQLLLENGAVYDLKNKNGKTPLCLSSDETILNLLKSLEKLFAAAKNDCSAEELALILELNKSHVNARDSSGGGTPLYWSASKGYVDICNFLLDSGADCCFVTNKGSTALHIAASKGFTEIVKAILKKMNEKYPEKVSALVNALTVTGTAALHVASNKEIACYLLQAGASYDVQNREDKTAMELAKNDSVQKLLKTINQLFVNVEKRPTEVLRVLDKLDFDELKAVIGAQNKHGQTLMQVALANNHENIANKLTEKIEKLETKEM